MKTEAIHIKGMVCDRCVASVKVALEDAGLPVKSVKLGEVLFQQPVSIDESTLENLLAPLGFELLHDKRKELVARVKALLATVYSGTFDFPIGFRFSHYVSEQLDMSYESISEAFASVEQRSLEKFLIAFRIGKVKELIAYNDHSFADIAYGLGFSSVAHLSRQFKEQTGLTLSGFRTMRNGMSPK